MTTQQHAAPGWYPDATGVIRWWDGQAWTAHVQPQPQHVIVHNVPGKPVNHVLHAILTVLTVGMWLPVWLIVAIAKNGR